MKYVVDSTVLIAIARGNRTVIEQFSWYKKHHIGVPQPVFVDVHESVGALGHRGAAKRWGLLAPELVRIAWTDAVTAKLIELERSDLDAIVAAHAIAADLLVVTTQPGRYAWVDGLRAEELVG